MAGSNAFAFNGTAFVPSDRDSTAVISARPTSSTFSSVTKAYTLTSGSPATQIWVGLPSVPGTPTFRNVRTGTFPNLANSIWVDWTYTETAPIASFDIFAKIGAGSYSLVGNVSAATRTFNYGNIAADTTYSFYIRAVSTSGLTTTGFEASTSLAGASLVSALGTSQTYNSATVSWTVTAGVFQKYFVYDNTAFIATVNGTELGTSFSYERTGLAQGTTYNFRVYGQNRDGFTGSYREANITTFRTPDAPALGTLTTSISSPNTVSTPSMTEDATNASFSWSNPSASGVTIGIPFTAPAYNGGITITDYEYSTDNGSTWKSAGTTSSPISITTVSSSSSALSSATSYTVKLRAVNSAGSGTSSSGSAKTTPSAVTSYTIRVYNNRGTETLTETVTGNTTGSYSRSHYQIAADWSVTVAALNSNGTGSFSAESSAATGWALASCTNYDPAACDSCGTKSTVCSKWTRSGSTDGACNVSCGTQSGCSGSWSNFDPADDGVYAISGGTYSHARASAAFPSGWTYCDAGGNLVYQGEYSGLPCAGAFLGPNDVQSCSLGGYRASGGDVCRYNEF